MSITLPVKIFFSYSHKDTAFCKELQKHLYPLKTAGYMSQWYDGEINPGENWTETIKANISKADIVLFLVSPDFLSSEYIYENEIKIALERHYKDECIVIPVMLRKCDIEFTPFAHLQGLPPSMEPILSESWFSPDDAYFQITQGLKKLIKNEIRKKENVSTAQNTGNIPGESKPAKLIGLFGNKYESSYKKLVKDSELQFLENIRQEIAMEIHDNITQFLIVARIILQHPKPEEDVIKQVLNMIELSINSLLQISRNLKMGAFDLDFSLNQSLIEVQSYFSGISSPKFIFHVKNLETISDSRLEVNVFRIVQELLNNVLKHSQASVCEVSVVYNNRLILVNVSDNGKGFDINKKNSHGGLSNVEARLTYLNGKYEISSSHLGTQIQISIPVTHYQT